MTRTLDLESEIFLPIALTGELFAGNRGGHEPFYVAWAIGEVYGPRVD